ncbi:MAG TPA: PadR family transcriptional regulator [Solirubrobacterales bacterium]|jgi:DNA-binding PadR family transcriptional regulator|nr:PadR family transcriptional regulator [Solirubrobacterales bacterium]
MSNEIRLGPPSYIVLGLLEIAGEATPYDLKQFVALTLGDFWTLPHAQLYTEPERLAKAGYLDIRQEEGGRHRKHYKVTERGKQAMQEWLAEPTDEMAEMRDPAVLKLFFGASPKMLADAQLPAHESRLARYEEMQKLAMLTSDGAPEGMRLALDVGVTFEREAVAFWKRMGEQGADDGASD